MNLSKLILYNYTLSHLYLININSLVVAYSDLFNYYFAIKISLLTRDIQKVKKLQQIFARQKKNARKKCVKENLIREIQT